MTRTGPGPDIRRTCNELALVSTWLAVIRLGTYGDVVRIWRQPDYWGSGSPHVGTNSTGRKGERGMTKDSDPVTVTLTRKQWKDVKRTLYANAFDKTVLLTIKRALEPVAAPDPATFEVEAPDPKRTKPWPVLKSSQEANADRA